MAGISGGADSVCLLFMLLEIRKQIPFTLKVVHVNHGIRKEAVEDADFVRKLCMERNIPFKLVEKNVKESAKQNGLSVEEEGRRIRYAAFENELIEGKGKIAVAHNSNDRAETMLFHMFRGTGLTGSSGIRPVKGKVIRPLLCLRRSEIENWLMERKISFCTDSTNEQDIYTRNRIRHHILTYAEKEVCQGAVVNMNRMADQLLEAEEFVVRQTKEALLRCVQISDQEEILVRIPEFLKEDEYLRSRILLLCIEQAAGGRKDITAAHIKSMEALFKGTGSKEIHLPYHITVYKKYDVGMIKREEVIPGGKSSKKEREETYYVTVPSVLEVPKLGRVEFTIFSQTNSQNIPEKTYTKWFDYDKITTSLLLRTRQPGDYLTIDDALHTQSVKQYMINEKIPKAKRDDMYLLADGAHILWVPGHRVSRQYRVKKNTRRILEVRLRGGSHGGTDRGIVDGGRD